MCRTVRPGMFLTDIFYYSSCSHSYMDRLLKTDENLIIEGRLPGMPRFTLRSDKPYTTTSTRSCQYCSREYNVKGYASHERACKTRAENLARDLEYEAALAAQAAEQGKYSVTIVKILIIQSISQFAH